MLGEVIDPLTFIRDEEVEAIGELRFNLSVCCFGVRSFPLYSGEPGAVVGREGGGVKGS